MHSTRALPEQEKSLEITTLRCIDLRGPAGRLESLLNEGAANSPVTALVCHPHPQGGGTMHNKVVYHATKVMNAPEFGFRWPVLRFNFRGTGLSEGSHDGVAESGDVKAALAWLHAEYRLPIVVVGFSFGAAMALLAGCGAETPVSRRANLRGVAALGLPTQGFGKNFRYPFLSECALPKLFLSGDRDEFAPKEDLQQVVAAAANAKNLVLIAGADHFFTGQLDAMQRELASWLKEQVQ